jgi:hypothetical protein
MIKIYFILFLLKPKCDLGRPCLSSYGHLSLIHIEPNPFEHWKFDHWNDHKKLITTFQHFNFLVQNWILVIIGLQLKWTLFWSLWIPLSHLIPLKSIWMTKFQSQIFKNKNWKINILMIMTVIEIQLSYFHSPYVYFKLQDLTFFQFC